MPDNILPIDGNNRSGKERSFRPCSICGGRIGIEAGGWTEGHNAWPINEGRCCRECNNDVVLPARIRSIQQKAAH